MNRSCIEPRSKIMNHSNYDTQDRNMNQIKTEPHVKRMKQIIGESQNVTMNQQYYETRVRL